eukprot:56616_1
MAKPNVFFAFHYSLIMLITIYCARSKSFHVSAEQHPYIVSVQSPQHLCVGTLLSISKSNTDGRNIILTSATYVFIKQIGIHLPLRLALDAPTLTNCRLQTH